MSKTDDYIQYVGDMRTARDNELNKFQRYADAYTALKKGDAGKAEWHIRNLAEVDHETAHDLTQAKHLLGKTRSATDLVAAAAYIEALRNGAQRMHRYYKRKYDDAVKETKQ